MFSDKYRLDDLTSKTGEDFVVTKMAIKRNCCCFWIQAPVEATSKIIREHGIKPDDVDEIIMGTNEQALSVVGSIVEPKDIIGAQFSAPFTLAMCLVKGSNGFRDYNEQNLNDPEITKLARRVRLEVDDEVQAMFPLRGVKMTVKLKDGTTYQEKLESARGTPENPMTHDEVKEKFRSLATVVVRDDRVEEIIKAVRGLDYLPNISSLCSLLVS